MSRQAIKTTSLSLDTASVIRKVYPKLAKFHEEHLQSEGINTVAFYSAMRGEFITPQLEGLIESCIDWKLRQLQISRETVEFLPPLSTLLEQMIAKVQGDIEVTRNTKDTRDLQVTLEIETQYQFLEHLRYYAQLSTKDQET